MQDYILSYIEENYVTCSFLFLYTISMPLVYWFGLPLRKQSNVFSEQKVSHSIIGKGYEKVKVFDQFYTEANIITLIGLIGLFLIVILVYKGIQTEIIPFLFCSAVILSDWLDGKACTRHNCHSKLGAILDPMRDRFAIFVLIFTLLYSTNLDSTIILLLTIMLLVEIGIISDSFKHWSAHKEVFTHHTGKMRQAVHLVGIFSVFSFTFLFSFIPIEIVVRIALFLMTIASVFHYNKLLESNKYCV